MRTSVRFAALLIGFLFVAFTGQSQKVKIVVDARKNPGRLELFWASQLVYPTEYLLTDWGKGFIRMLI